MNAIDLLNEQHDEVDELLAEAEKASGATAKGRLFARIADALAIHAAIEEQIFYPMVKARRTEDILLESLEEHLGIKRVLADMLEVDPSDERFDAKLTVLKEQVQHHVEEERSELFPKVEKLFDEDQLEAIGEELQSMTDEMEGTDPRFSVRKETEEAAPLH